MEKGLKPKRCCKTFEEAQILNPIVSGESKTHHSKLSYKNSPI